MVAGLLDAERVGLILRPQLVADDLLHRLLRIEIIEAVGLANGQRQVDAGGNEVDRPRIMRGQIFDNDGRFQHRAVARIVAQRRHLAGRRNLQEGRARLSIAKIDDDRRERRGVLVQRDQRLPAEGGQRMEMKRQGHFLLACFLVYRWPAPGTLVIG